MKNKTNNTPKSRKPKAQIKPNSTLKAETQQHSQNQNNKLKTKKAETPTCN